MPIKEKLNFNQLILIQFLNFFHFADEYFFSFPEWATKHFGTTSRNYYLLSHALIILVIGVIMLGIKKGSKAAVFSALSIQTIFFTNGLFHIVTTLLWSEYSPGLASQIVIFPGSVIAYKMIHDSRVLSGKQMFLSLIIGTLVSILIILSLYLNITL